MCPRPGPDYVVAGAAVAQLGRARREEASKGRQQTVQVLPGTEGKSLSSVQKVVQSCCSDG